MTGEFIMITKEEILDKARKLRALSASPNEHESALALKKMQAILIKHNLTERDLEKDEFGNVIYLYYDEVWVRYIAAGISELYFCRVVRRKTATSKTEYIIIGKPEHGEVVKEILSGAVDYINKSSKNPAYDRRSFCMGAAVKIFERCKILIELAKKGDLVDEVGEALVIGDMYAKTLDAVDAFIEKSMKIRTQSSRQTKSVDRASFGAGTMHGGAVDLQKKFKK